MIPNAWEASPILINGIQRGPDGEVRIIYKENHLVNSRPNERHLLAIFEDRGYSVELGDQVGATAFWSLLSSKQGGRPEKHDIWALLSSDAAKIELNPQIRV